ncbi:RNA polymerase sigma-70 factor [Draconibacterium sp. IB214405]|uniref:RNA polymerase sigma-70 factor n=1 Tax=Draconibacterium sp. IB214405 TaxID=3097352 RepID=UPI002A12B8C5|nr:RNA polymerase sigma-70 factor [Draconibacterium sp. IB214405]MDX8339343.1 RNA polymerase sigma-70 factor [Draconibacterium sp. IB214405]
MDKRPDIKSLLILISSDDDEKAFKTFFDIFASKLYQFSFSFLKKKLLVEEVISDVFFKVWLNRQNLSKIENIKAYLYKATYNTTLNYLAEEKRIKAIALEDLDVKLGVDCINPETKLIDKELREILNKAIESLPPRCKLIYKMAKVEEMKYKEIASLLDISVKTIDNQISIAVERIGKEIKTYLENKGDTKQYLTLFHLFLPKD